MHLRRTSAAPPPSDERRRASSLRVTPSGPASAQLLLDEPTNHLDAQSVAWLQSYLEGFKGTVVAITRDRDFLEKSCG